MSKRIYLSVICCLFATQALAVSQAYIDGQTDAANSLGNTAGGVTQTNVDGVGNPYGGNTTTLQNTYGTSNNNNAGLYSTGQQQVTDCKTVPPNSPPNVLQYCAGVNALALNPLQNARTQTGLTKTDPIFTNPNSGYNLGLAAAGTTPSTVGSGTAQGGVVGAGSCTTTAGATPPVYTTENCDRAAGASTQLCTKVILPSVTTTPYCNISGTAFAYTSPILMPTPSGLPVYQIDFSCANMATGQAVIQQYLPLWGPSFTCNYIPGNCPYGGNINAAYPVGTLFFAPGATTAPITWWSMVNYDGTALLSTTAWYDGPSNKVIVTNSQHSIQTLQCLDNGTGSGAGYCTGLGGAFLGVCQAAQVGGACWYIGDYSTYTSGFSNNPSITTTTSYGWVMLSCPANYTEVAPLISQGTTLKPGYCTNPGDPTSVEMVPTYVKTGICGSDWTQTSFYCMDPVTRLSMGVGFCSGKNVGATCVEIPSTIVCDANHTGINYTITTGTWGSYVTTDYTTCIPSNLRVLNYAPAATSNAGSCGINHILTATVANTCTTLQAQTPFPTAFPATSVNGVYTCPTGKTVSGSTCI